MSVLSLIKSLNERATRLEDEAKALKADAAQLQALFLGEPEEAPEAAPVTPPPAKAPVATVPQMPNRDEIRAKAAEFGVDVDDLLPLGKKPTLQQKQDAMQRIYKAKRAKEAQGQADALTVADITGKPGSGQAQTDDAIDAVLGAKDQAAT